MNPMVEMLIRKAEASPEIASNPMAASWLKTVKGGNHEEIEKLARNLCDSRGVTVEQTISDAKRFFGVPR